MDWRFPSKYEKIIDREDFSFIFKIENVEAMRDVLKYGLLQPEFDNKNLKFLTTYWERLESFSDWVNASSLPQMKSAVEDVFEMIGHVKSIIKSTPNRHSLHSRLKKLSKRFLHDIKLMGVSLKSEVFNYTFFNHIPLTKEQMIQFMIDESVGLGKKYELNFGPNKFDFVNRFRRMEDSYAKKVLERLIKGNVRESNGQFIVLGSDKVRVLTERKMFGRKKVYRVYVADGAEHEVYTKEFTTFSPNQIKFISS